MPFNFSANPVQFVAKNGVVSDGEIFTVGTGTVYSGTASGTNVLSYTGLAVVSAVSDRSAFKVPVHGATGVWSVQMKDSARGVICEVIQPISTGALSAVSPIVAQIQPVTAASGGQLVLNWVFQDSLAAPADVPVGGQFQVYVVYNESV
jgi:hypothetical protein